VAQIFLLAEEIYNKIAAGEVIERPASIVKELIENSIDAGSTKISVVLTDGGIGSIMVKDNGDGISYDDVDRAFLRHATSKLRNERDLLQITTLGFRGEALASIAAVSEITLRTSDNEHGIGVQAKVSAGKLLEKTEIGFARGTEILVERLFHSLPARLKYFKSVENELGHIIDYVNRLSFAHPAIAFVLENNGRELLRTAGDGKLIHVIAAVYGNFAASKMRAIEIESIDYEIEGYTSTIEITRASRNYMTVLINNRYIKNFLLQRAILNGYNDLLMVNRYPVTVINIKMDPSIVDINVHPAKLEAKFSKEQELFELIETGVRKALLTEGQIPTPLNKEIIYRYKEQDTVSQLAVDLVAEPNFAHLSNEAIAVEPPTDIKINESGKLPYIEPIAQIFGTYILAQNDDGLYLIDQHAAHERINYELNLAKITNCELEIAELLVPISIDYPADEITKLQSRANELAHLGLELEQFGAQTLLVRTVPSWIPKGEEQLYIESVLQSVIAENPVNLLELNRDLVAGASCKASIKANQAISTQEMLSLINRLRETTNPYTCPHGRPITILISKYELEKMFKRVT